MEVEDQVCLTHKANKEYIHVSHIRHTYKEVSVWKRRTRSVAYFQENMRSVLGVLARLLEIAGNHYREYFSEFLPCRIFSREYATCSGCSGTFAGNHYKEYFSEFVPCSDGACTRRSVIFSTLASACV